MKNKKNEMEIKLKQNTESAMAQYEKISEPTMLFAFFSSDSFSSSYPPSSPSSSSLLIKATEIEVKKKHENCESTNLHPLLPIYINIQVYIYFFFSTHDVSGILVIVTKLLQIKKSMCFRQVNNLAIILRWSFELFV